MTMIKKLTAAVLLGATAVGLAGCATTLPTRVTRYSAMPVPAGQTFAIVPGPGAAARGGLEFQSFAQLASQQLEARGYRQVASPAQAQLIVQLGYGVDGGRQIVREQPFGGGFGYGGLGYGRFGGGLGFGLGFGRPYYSRFGYYGYRDPFFWGWDDPFWAGGVDVYTEYRSQLTMDIRDRTTNQPLFDGRAQARSTRDDLGRLVPSLLEARAAMARRSGSRSPTARASARRPGRRTFAGRSCWARRTTVRRAHR